MQSNWPILFNSLIKTKEYKPSFVVYTGDFISYENEKQFEQLDEELKHSVKGEFATLGILGSHDYGENWSDQVVKDKVKNILDYNKFCYWKISKINKWIKLYRSWWLMGVKLWSKNKYE